MSVVALSGRRSQSTAAPAQPKSAGVMRADTLAIRGDENMYTSSTARMKLMHLNENFWR